MKRKYFWFLTVLLGSFFFSSCTLFVDEYDDLPRHTGEGYDVPVQESGDGYELTYQFNRNVTELKTDEQLRNIVEFRDDSLDYFHTLVYAAGTPEDQIPKVGEILTSTNLEKFPYGLGDKVVSVEQKNGQYVVHTEHADLQEIFKEFELDAYLPFGDYLTGYDYYDCDSTLHHVDVEQLAKTRANDGDFDDGLNLPVNIPFDGGFDISRGRGNSKKGEGKVGGHIGITGGIKTNVKVKCKVSLKDGFAFDFDMKPNVGEKFFTLGVDASVNGSFTKDIFGSDDFLNGKFRWPVGPIVLVPIFGAKVSVGGDLTLDGKLQYERSFTMKMGYDKEKGSYNDKTTSHNDLRLLASLDGKLTGGVYFTLGVGVFTKFLSFRVEPAVFYEIACNMGETTTTIVGDKSEDKFDIESNPCLTTGWKFGLGISFVFKYDLWSSFLDMWAEDEAQKDDNKILPLPSPWLSSKTDPYGTGTAENNDKLQNNGEVGLRLGPWTWNLTTPSNHLLWPKIQDESFSIIRSWDQGMKHLVFNGKFKIEDPGLFRYIRDYRPMIRIKRGNEAIMDVPCTGIINSATKAGQSFTASITGLQEGVSYTAIPCYASGSNEPSVFDRGMAFCTTTPSLAIEKLNVDDIVENYFEINGEEVLENYTYHFTTITNVVGIENIDSWGLIDMTDDNEDTRYHFVKNTDGKRYRHRWKATTNADELKVELKPFLFLKGVTSTADWSKAKFFETFKSTIKGPWDFSESKPYTMPSKNSKTPWKKPTYKLELIGVEEID